MPIFMPDNIINITCRLPFLTTVNMVSSCDVVIHTNTQQVMTSPEWSLERCGVVGRVKASPFGLGRNNNSMNNSADIDRTKLNYQYC